MSSITHSNVLMFCGIMDNAYSYDAVSNVLSVVSKVAIPAKVYLPSSINAQDEAVLKGILTNPNVIKTIRHHARFGEVLEYRIPGGQGARFTSNGKTFKGFKK